MPTRSRRPTLVEEFGVDGFRYHFLRDQHFGPDGDISYEAMVARYNADLANNFGNLANRVLNMAANYCGGVVPDARDDGPLVAVAAQAFSTLTAAMERLDFSNGFGAVWELIRATNSYIEERQPWALNKAGDAAATAAVLGDCLEALRIVALLASPLIPRAIAELWRRLGSPHPGHRRSSARGRSVGRPARRCHRRQGRPALPPHRGLLGVTVPTPAWVDSHCHLPLLCDEADGAVSRARDAGRRRHDLRRHRPRLVAGGRRRRRPLSRRPGHRRAAPARRVRARRGLGRARVPSRQSEGVVGIGETGFDLYYEHSVARGAGDARSARTSTSPAAWTSRW